MADADASGLQDEERRQYLQSHVPRIIENLEAPDEPPSPSEPRRRVASSRLSRSAQFARAVLGQYDNACAVCETQLRIVEAAHIIPVHDERCRDESWNGVSLCRNHHRLFDLRILRVNTSGTVCVQEDDVNFLRQLGILGGFDRIVEPYIGSCIKLPRFYHDDARLRRQFQNALKVVHSL
ncbi:MAG: HNH endonuclease [Candidatus Hydrogenedentes bacterium]|nr:HNH endonuclease [Candidatus Hydrogenedentota bacterium]